MKKITYYTRRPEFGINKCAGIVLFFNLGHNGDLPGIK